MDSGVIVILDWPFDKDHRKGIIEMWLFFLKIALLSKEDLINKNLKIYPNPSNGNFVVEVDDLVNLLIEIVIYNNLGQVVFEQLYGDGKQIEVLTKLKQGIYDLVINNQKILWTKKVVVQ